MQEALKSGGFADLDEAHAAELDDEEFAALEQKVEAYKADYAETLVTCQALVGDEDDSE